MGIMTVISQVLDGDGSLGSAILDFRKIHLPTPVPPNVPLTLMIVIQLVLHIRNIRTAMGATGTDGLCKTIITMFVESSALFAVSSLLVIGPPSHGIEDLFLAILAETQVRAFPQPRSSGGSS